MSIVKMRKLILERLAELEKPQVWLAKQLDVRPGHLSSWMSGQVRWPDPQRNLKLYQNLDLALKCQNGELRGLVNAIWAEILRAEAEEYEREATSID